MTGRTLGMATALILLLSGCASDAPVGRAAPAFTAEDAQGNTVSLAAFEGGVLILDFWAVW